MTGDSPLRVLQLNSGSRDFGGVSSILYNIYTHIDRAKVQFDFLSPEETTYGIHREEIEAMGGTVSAFGITGSALARKLKLYRRLKAFLKEKPYSIVHINSGNFFFNLLAARAAKAAGVKNRIVHSHNVANTDAGGLKSRAIAALRPLLTRVATACFACSESAGRFMFSDNPPGGAVKVIRNGIEVERFAWDPEARARLRRELGIDEGAFVVGHVGRMERQKNQEFAIAAFARLARARPDAVLALVGEGSQTERMREEARRLGVADRVRFIGARTDVQALYQMFDAFAFPSRFEGFGMVLVEAQIAGLRCVASDRVPRETNVAGLATYLPIGAGDEEKWAAALLRIAEHPQARRSHAKEAAAAGYDIRDVARGLQDFYLSCEK